MGNPENRQYHETTKLPEATLDAKFYLDNLKDEVELTTNEKKLYYITQVLIARKDELKFARNATSISFIPSAEKKLRIQYLEKTLNELKKLNSEESDFINSLRVVFNTLKPKDKKLIESLLETQNIKEMELKSLELIRQEDWNEQIENIFTNSFNQEIQIWINILRNDKKATKQIEDKTRWYLIKAQADIYTKAIEEFETNKEEYIKGWLNSPEELHMIMLQAYKSSIQEKLMLAYISKHYFDEKWWIEIPSDKQLLWDEYVDSTDVKDEWFNISDNTENFIAELLMYDLPTIVVSGWVAWLAWKAMNKWLKAWMLSTWVDTTSFWARSALFIWKAATEWLVFTATYDAVRYRSWFLNHPEWWKHVALNTFFFAAARVLWAKQFTKLSPNLEWLIKTWAVLPAAVVTMDLALSYEKVLNNDPDLQDELISEFLVLSILGWFLHLAPSAIWWILKWKVNKYEIELNKDNGKWKINWKDFKLTNKAREKLENRNKTETKVEAKTKIKELETKVDKLNAELEAINTKAWKASFMTQKLVARLKEYKAEINRLKWEKEVKIKDLDRLESKLEWAKEETKVLKEVLDDIETELAIRNSELEISESYLRIAQQRAKKLENELSNSRLDISQANKRIELLENSLKNNKELLERAEKSKVDTDFYIKRVAELEANLKEAQTYKTKLKDLEQSLKERQVNNEKLSEKLKEQKAEKDRLNQNLEQTNSTIRTTKLELTKAREKLESAKKDWKLKDEELSFRENQIKDLETRLENFNKIKQDYTKIKQELSIKEKELWEMLNSLKTKDNQIIELEQKNAWLTNEIISAKESLTNLRNSLNRIRDSKSEAFKKLEKQIKEKEADIQRYKEAEAELNKSKIEIKKAEEAVNKLTEQTVKQNDRLLTKRKTIEALEAKFAKLSKSLEKAKQNLAKKEAEWNSKEVELKKAMLKIEELERNLKQLLQTRVPNLEDKLEKERKRKLDFSGLETKINKWEDLAKQANSELDELLKQLESF